jgi:hypothetical protein
VFSHAEGDTYTFFRLSIELKRLDMFSQEVSDLDIYLHEDTSKRRITREQPIVRAKDT